MSYTIQLLRWNWYLFVPFLLVFAPLLLRECLKREREDTVEGGLLKACLPVVPLTLIGMVLFIAAGLAAGRMQGRLLMILAQTVAVGLSVLAGYRLAGLAALKKKKRIAAVMLMLLLYIVWTVLFICIGSGMTT